RTRNCRCPCWSCRCASRRGPYRSGASQNKWEEEKRQRAIEGDQRRWKEAGEARHAELKRALDNWGEQKRIETFFNEAELTVTQLLDVEQAPLLERIELVRKMIGSADALHEIEIGAIRQGTTSC